MSNILSTWRRSSLGTDRVKTKAIWGLPSDLCSSKPSEPGVNLFQFTLLLTILSSMSKKTILRYLYCVEVASSEHESRQEKRNFQKAAGAYDFRLSRSANLPRDRGVQLRVPEL